jgi:hypothetical protein
VSFFASSAISIQKSFTLMPALEDGAIAEFFRDAVQTPDKETIARERIRERRDHADNSSQNS